jgi:uncharacterized membrane protein
MIFAAACLGVSSFFLYLGVDKVIHRKYAAQGWFPMFGGLFFVIASAMCLIQAHRTDKNEALFVGWREVSLITVSALVFVFMLRYLGLTTASFIFSLGLMLALNYPFKRSLAASAGISLFLYILFGRLVVIVF